MSGGLLVHKQMDFSSNELKIIMLMRYNSYLLSSQALAMEFIYCVVLTSSLNHLVS